MSLRPDATAGKITCSSNKAKVKVSKNGKATIAKKFSGRAIITIGMTDKNYKTVTKKIVINVRKNRFKKTEPPQMNGSVFSILYLSIPTVAMI